MSDLFDTPKSAIPAPRPLADRLRPQTLAEVIGQSHVLSAQGPLGSMIGAHSLSSLILWGPPGVGKTTIARLLAQQTDLAFVQISAIFTGVPDLRKVFETAKIRRQNGQGTLLFVDEIHRFNKAQQDGFLPYMEDGTILLVGATTENPSFELNAALLSRAQVIVLERLSPADLERLAQRAEQDLGRTLPLDGFARETLIEMADGDGRTLLNLIEQVAAWALTQPLTSDQLSTRLMRRASKYDKSGEEHYNLISALHKSVRGSDPDAALYWFARMLEGGEDPRFLARRITRMAVEDIGLADPQKNLPVRRNRQKSISGHFQEGLQPPTTRLRRKRRLRCLHGCGTHGIDSSTDEPKDHERKDDLEKSESRFSDALGGSGHGL